MANKGYVSSNDTITIDGVDDDFGIDPGNMSYNTTYTTSPPYTVTNATSTSTITIDPTINDGDIEVSGDIKVNGKSLKDFMEKVSDRLSILTPDPKLLEKYDALKEAYEHYKILEKLCTDDGTVHKKT